jgi:flagellar motor protein MotB
VDQLLGSTRSLDELKARLERLRKTEQAAEARRLTLQRLTLQLKPLSDAGFLSVSAREQTVVVAVPNDKLFEGPRQEIRATGEAVLKQIAVVLKTYPARRFEVRARTDKDPSAVRAIDITRRLVVLGVRPDALSATSYAERGRVEIALVPQPDEIAP